LPDCRANPFRYQRSFKPFAPILDPMSLSGI
jgi:hypothetical protein